jgi:5-methyltetrahydrofolate--homocysteine methyltransferase
MVHVAKEMERRGLRQPLLIGGATTSKQHTAVKIAPEYSQSTVHVLDASRAVGVVSSLLDPRQRAAFDRNNVEEQARLRGIYGLRKEHKLLSYLEALANRTKIEWRAEDLPRPAFVGRRRLDDVPLESLAPFIDWTFFFSAWELKGRFPKILDHPEHGAAARELYGHAQELLKRICEEKLLRAQGVYGFWPAASDGDDIILYSDESRERELLRFCMLRAQQVFEPGKPNRSLADWIAPVAAGFADHLGAFAVTAGLGAAELVQRFEALLDDYNAILVKALADRLAEAFAEWLHARVRREWGYGLEERLTNEDLIEEKYRGIRPAFGYPACPDHSEKRKLFTLLDAEGVGMELTEHFAMLPAASVSGIYLAHPQARYFTVGRIGRDQVEEYARRKGIDVKEAERWLGPNLAYDPER